MSVQYDDGGSPKRTVRHGGYESLSASPVSSATQHRQTPPSPMSEAVAAGAARGQYPQQPASVAVAATSAAAKPKLSRVGSSSGVTIRKDPQTVRQQVRRTNSGHSLQSYSGLNASGAGNAGGSGGSGSALSRGSSGGGGAGASGALFSRGIDGGSDAPLASGSPSTDGGESSPLLRRSGSISSQKSRNHAVRVHQTCPTCHGKGRVVKDALGKEELVALVPYGDDRLKPSRRGLTIALSVLATAAVITLVVFFLYPREVTVSLSLLPAPGTNVNITCINDKFPKQRIVVGMTILWELHFKNPNFLAVSLEGGTNVTTVHNFQGGFANMSKTSIKPRSAHNITLPMNVTFTGVDGCTIWENNCLRGNTPPFNEFLVNFDFLAKATIMSFHDTLTVNKLSYVFCPIRPPSNETTSCNCR
eukprot:m.50494 g.50494  ORF g.50494 m.50494 type:complete len:418 (+) comp12155_c1_seq1:320-1573(+)